MSKHFKTLAMLVAVATATVLVIACDEDLIDDATFRLWCGTELCSWRLDEGRIDQAPTWHPNDFGVELLDNPTTISQQLKSTAACLTFTAIADIAPGTDVTVSFDFDGDGRIDHSEAIAATGFETVKRSIQGAVSNGPARIFISKKSPGRAVLAQIRLQRPDGCSGTGRRLRGRALGDTCEGPASEGSSDCASGICCRGICSECCGGRMNRDAGDDDAGEADAGPTNAVNACADAGVCERHPSAATGLSALVIPYQCEPGQRLRPRGTACLAYDDCMSGKCDGNATLKEDTVSGQPSTCTAEFPDAGGENCPILSVRPGRCL